MVVKGEVLGYRVFRSGACQLFISDSSPVSSSDKVFASGRMIYTVWQGKGTYNFNNPPRLLGAAVSVFVGRDESGVIEITPKEGGEKK